MRRSRRNKNCASDSHLGIKAYSGSLHQHSVVIRGLRETAAGRMGRLTIKTAVRAYVFCLCFRRECDEREQPHMQKQQKPLRCAWSPHARFLVYCLSDGQRRHDKLRVQDTIAGETLQTSYKVDVIATKAILPGLCPWLEDSYLVSFVDDHPERKGHVARTKGASGLTSFASEPSTGLRRRLLGHHPRLEGD